MKLTREFYIPKGAKRVRARHSAAVAYCYTAANGKLTAMLFYGKQAKPIWHYHFETALKRQQKIERGFAHYAALEAQKAAKRAEEKAWQHPYKPGDIFKSSWGYDQTNIDWYEVLEVRGKQLVMTEIQQSRVETQWAVGKCVPLPGKPRGEPFRALAQKGHIKVGRQYAWFQEPKMVGGVPTYEAANWTAYA